MQIAEGYIILQENRNGEGEENEQFEEEGNEQCTKRNRTNILQRDTKET